MRLSAPPAKPELTSDESFTIKLAFVQLWFRMATANDTVHGRFEQARTELTPTQLAVGAALIAALGFALLFVQDPMLHDSMHNFRHTAGITCH
jgi:cobalt transporter subunit CbtB